MNLKNAEKILQNRRNTEIKLLGLRNEETIIYNDFAIYLLADYFQVSPKLIRKDFKYFNALEPKNSEKEIAKECIEFLNNIVTNNQKNIFHTKEEFEENGIFEDINLPEDWALWNGKLLIFQDKAVEQRFEHAARCLLSGFPINEVLEYFSLLYPEEPFSRVDAKLLNSMKIHELAEKRKKDIEKMCNQIFEKNYNPQKRDAKELKELLSALTGCPVSKIHPKECMKLKEKASENQNSITSNKNKKKKLAYDLWMTNISQEKIAEVFGVTRVTVVNWIREEKSKHLANGEAITMPPESKRFEDKTINSNIQTYEDFVKAFDYRKQGKELERDAEKEIAAEIEKDEEYERD